MSASCFQSVFVLFRFAPLKQNHARMSQKTSAAIVGHAKLALTITCVPPTRAIKINIHPRTLRKVFIFVVILRFYLFL